MPSPFDTVIPRRGTGNIKYDRRPDLDPFWVADMDFASCPEILDALHRRVDHGIFGYAQAHDGLNEAVIQYLASRHHAQVPLDHIVHLGGLVPALSLAARAFCPNGEAVMTCTPVYPPFLGVHRDAAAKLITVDHILVDGRFEFDLEAMAAAVTPETRVFILCNPQNPLGRAFTENEVVQVATFCRDHDLILVSDEIHCDLILDEAATPHFSATRLPDDLRQRTITLLSPSKTWNIAGLGYAFAVIPDDTLRRRFGAARGHTLSEINALAFYAAEAAYRHGEPWRRELVTYLRGNRDTLHAYLAEHAPQLHPVLNDATYLSWIDARETSHENPAEFLESAAKLFVSDGAYFGWPGWIRFNFACPRSRMLEGLEKMTRAFAGA
ncbi:cystathionine beta-lyase [Haloferula luteola]|uniref:cysteine-S-conjugate beta-lyase n=1 Tax=Haloferula luteola TaxID=595692 RepID=A0A840V588_9BACT|nr:PatB family C-S lyase [Haloferula luteola]MBB5353132.1 cystathionine beta-lyase [Haloferula luteola]